MHRDIEDKAVRVTDADEKLKKLDAQIELARKSLDALNKARAVSGVAPKRNDPSPQIRRPVVARRKHSDVVRMLTVVPLLAVAGWLVFARPSVGHHVFMNRRPAADRPSTHHPTWRPRRTTT